MSEPEGKILRVRLDHRPAGPSKGRLVLLSLVSTLALISVLELVARRLDSKTLGFHFNGKEFGPPIEFFPDLTTNSHGFHDVEWPIPDDDSIRVVLLGESYVAGYWVRTAGTVGQRLQTHLTSGSGRRHIVYSIAKSGWGQRQALPALRQHGKALDPDLVSVSTPHGVLGAEEGRRQLEAAYPALVGQDIDLELPDRRLAEYARSRGIDFLPLEPIFRDKSQGRRGAFPWVECKG